MSKQPALFISHGAPTLLTDKSPAHGFLKSLGRDIVQKARPDAILIMSAHFEAVLPTLTSNERPKTIYDFYGFPAALSKHVYNAPGSAELAIAAQTALCEQGIDAALDSSRGFDHGTWIPLSLMFPAADIPIVQLSINPRQTPEYHFSLGRSLAALRAQNILIIGSGNLTHNLHEYFKSGYILDAPAPSWVSEFSEWLAVHIKTGDVNAVLGAVSQAPHGWRNHPTLDHIHPLFFALGAGVDTSMGVGSISKGKRLHASYSYGVLAMDVYAFGD